jgi:hypothetical protein
MEFGLLLLLLSYKNLTCKSGANELKRWMIVKGSLVTGGQTRDGHSEDGNCGPGGLMPLLSLQVPLPDPPAVGCSVMSV